MIQDHVLDGGLGCVDETGKTTRNFIAYDGREYCILLLEMT